MKRRQFIQSGSLMSLPIFLGGMEVSAMGRSSLFGLNGPKEDRVIVLIQLNGGNDGLNMIIPVDQYSALSAVRPQIMLPENAVLRLTDKTGIHPIMEEMHAMYKEGELAVVQSVGYPNQNRSHFRSTDIWTTGSESNVYLRSGWMGRYFDETYPGYPNGYPNAEHPDPFAITLGSIVSETCQGEVANYSFTLVNEASVRLVEETVKAPADNSCYSKKLDDIHTTVKQSNAYASTVLQAFDKGTNKVTYPADNRLANQLKVVANLISGGLQTKIYVVNIGGFDTHANQVNIGDTINGAHANLLSTISEAVSLFMSDIKALGVHEQVMGMTFSEFGRQIKANNSYGTDHGTAAPLLVFGTCVESGIYGHNPEISPTTAAQEGVPMQHDFRSVYASMLIDWLGADEQVIKDVLYKDFNRIPFVKGCESTPSSTTDQMVSQVKIQPNPTSDTTTVTLDHPGGRLHVSVMDVLGSLVETSCDKYVGRGTHTIPVEMHRLPIGTYFVRIVSGGQVMTSKVVKQ
jgi:uncharacterized protein (DUF1501 family)